MHTPEATIGMTESRKNALYLHLLFLCRNPFDWRGMWKKDETNEANSYENNIEESEAWNDDNDEDWTFDNGDSTDYSSDLSDDLSDSEDSYLEELRRRDNIRRGNRPLWQDVEAAFLRERETQEREVEDILQQVNVLKEGCPNEQGAAATVSNFIKRLLPGGGAAAAVPPADNPAPGGSRQRTPPPQYSSSMERRTAGRRVLPPQRRSLASSLRDGGSRRQNKRHRSRQSHTRRLRRSRERLAGERRGQREQQPERVSRTRGGQIKNSNFSGVVSFLIVFAFLGQFFLILAVMYLQPNPYVGTDDNTYVQSLQLMVNGEPFGFLNSRSETSSSIFDSQLDYVSRLN